ncbi:MAG TPA: hypothetical protein VK627_03785, partial [Edaphobacter sp.]|nr:hypothetical protein [Edaphobacter sp.]
MRLFSSALLLATLCGSGAAFAAQDSVPSQPSAAQTSKTPSAILQPALDTLRQTLELLQPERWKTSNAIREEADANINSIRRDLDATLPPLLAAADGAPNSVVQVLPVFRNVEALYDVLLRVSEAGKTSAPSQQSTALDQAITSLEAGRRALGDSIQSAALAQEQQVHDQQAALRAIPPAPAPAPCAPPPPVKKRKPPPKPP